jgi:hypothetical protein
MIISYVVDMGELKDTCIATYRRSGKEPIIEVNSDKEEEEARVSTSDPIQFETICNVDTSVAYQWRGIYHMFQQDFYLDILEDKKYLGVY